MQNEIIAHEPVQAYIPKPHEVAEAKLDKIEKARIEIERIVSDMPLEWSSMAVLKVAISDAWSNALAGDIEELEEVIGKHKKETGE